MRSDSGAPALPHSVSIAEAARSAGKISQRGNNQGYYSVLSLQMEAGWGGGGGARGGWGGVIG